jgi:hypothetical protein
MQFLTFEKAFSICCTRYFRRFALKSVYLYLLLPFATGFVEISFLSLTLSYFLLFQIVFVQLIIFSEMQCKKKYACTPTMSQQRLAGIALFAAHTTEFLRGFNYFEMV